MKNEQDPHSTQEIKPSTLVSHNSQSEQQNNEIPLPESGSFSSSSNENRKVSREDIELVQNLIERCLQLYMNKDEVVKTLLTRTRINSGFTTLVWQKLEEENPEFFRAYYIRLKLRKQIILFNHLLEHQYHLMKYPMPPKVLGPMHNGNHPVLVNNLHMGYPVIQQPPVPATGQAHLCSVGYSTSSLHVVNGVPATGNFHPMQINSGNEMLIDSNAVDLSPAIPPNNALSSMSDMLVSPTSAESSGHFPFSGSEISGMGIEMSGLTKVFTSDVATSVGLQLSSENDPGALGNYDDSPFLPSDSDILLGSPEANDIVEDFFVDSVPGPSCLPSDEEKS
ncbi:Hypothetical predicted protein [Olea europaea subsp. europaea]|uniref:Angiotensin-converting enzyme 2 n=1 Tax=Olea europaea subsp. europaea TaxID=158383 RepID=A0A8S0TKC9_OLEEU|nr:Hypothetical predicted protein [Olea europaea subsp. europaea]